MAITEAFTGTATIGTTEWDMPSNTAFTVGTDVQTDDGVYQLFLDASAMAALDQFQIKIYEKVASAGTQRAVCDWTLLGAQSDPHAVSPAMILLHGWAMTIVKLSGTDRSFTWSIRKVA